MGTLLAAVVLAGCGVDGQEPTIGRPDDGGPTDVDVRMARATWQSGFMQAEIYRQLLEELGYTVSDPSDATVDPVTFYPRLARGEYDMWAHGWFPLHAPFLERELVTGASLPQPIEPVGLQADDGAVQGYLVDKATADELGITSMTDFQRPEVADAFDDDGDGSADLFGCEVGWGCNLVIDQHIETLEWGESVEQVVGDYAQSIAEVQERVDAGIPALFYTWTPNWTVEVLRPGVDVVWLESPALPEEDEPTSVAGLEGCAGPDPCDLGWPVNDIRAVANTDFLDANPPIRRLLELVEIPPDDIAVQNARMAAVDGYTDAQVADDAAAWIADNRDVVDAWLDQAGGD